MIRIVGISFLLCALLEWISCICSKVMLVFVTIRYGNEFVSEIKELILAVSIGMLVILLITKRVKHNPLKAKQWRELRISVYTNYPLLASIRRLLLFLLAILTGACMTAYAYFISHGGIASIALALDQAKMYEAAEIVYLIVPDKALSNDDFRYGNYTLSNWKTKCKVESASEIRNRNLAIARVYGINSIEMAGRYNHLARAFTSEYRDEKATYWCKKAVRIYNLNDVPRMSADSITRLALSEKDTDKERQYFAEAYELANQIPDESIDSNLLVTLSMLANSLEDTQSESKVKQRLSSVLGEHEKPYRAKLVILQRMGSCLYVILAIWLIAIISRLAIVELLSRKLKKLNSLEALSNLVTLELYRDNLHRADQYSKELLDRMN